MKITIEVTGKTKNDLESNLRTVVTQINQQLQVVQPETQETTIVTKHPDYKHDIDITTETDSIEKCLVELIKQQIAEDTRSRLTSKTEAKYPFNVFKPPRLDNP